jgi:hypothetical protein
LLLKLEVKVFWSFAKLTSTLGAGLHGPLSGDFPAARGLLPIQARSGAMADPARRRLVLVVVVFEVQRGLVVFLLFLVDLSVRLLL